MVGQNHRLNGCGFEQTPGDGEGQGSLLCCSPWDRKELDTTEQMNGNNKALQDRLQSIKPSTGLLGMQSSKFFGWHTCFWVPCSDIKGFGLSWDEILVLCLTGYVPLDVFLHLSELQLFLYKNGYSSNNKGVAKAELNEMTCEVPTQCPHLKSAHVYCKAVGIPPPRLLYLGYC